MQVEEEIRNRKGAGKATDIPKEVLELLNQGRIESVNLTEWLAVNHLTLLESVIPTVGLERELPFISMEIRKQKTESGMKAIRLIGLLLAQILNKRNDQKKEIILQCSHHPSDSVRCWAAYIIKNEHRSINEHLSSIKPFAADHHFGVREIAWMSIREDLAKNLDESIKLLTDWAKSNDEYIRRFSVEVIRPRGVWCKHIDCLKQTPQIALPILTLLKSDPSKYVQDSVGNWLNDASKTQPDWVTSLCKQWEQESPSKATSRISKKAQRTIRKSKKE